MFVVYLQVTLGGQIPTLLTVSAGRTIRPGASAGSREKGRLGRLGEKAEQLFLLGAIDHETKFLKR